MNHSAVIGMIPEIKELIWGYRIYSEIIGIIQRLQKLFFNNRDDAMII